jgi:hypothetical protein
VLHWHSYEEFGIVNDGTEGTAFGHTEEIRVMAGGVILAPVYNFRFNVTNWNQND